MTIEDLLETARGIVEDADRLRLDRAPGFSGAVGYCCVFCRSLREHAEMDALVRAYGRVAQDTPTGFTYRIPALDTAAGPLRILKIRRPDPSRPERGDADFSLDDFPSFRAYASDREGFRTMQRPSVEMVELVDPRFDVRCYFSNPPVEEHPGIREALADRR